MAKPLSKDFVANKHLGLSIEKPEIPDFVRKAAAENGLQEKPEVHISVVVTKNAMQMWKAAGAKGDASIEALFKTYVWEYSLTDEYFLHERKYTRQNLTANGYAEDIPEHTRRTIVQKVLLPDLPIFYAKVNETLGISLPVPTPHITLFAWSDYEPFKTRGIGINSAEEFKQFTKQLISQ
ncbi:MAG: hypothetical protein AAB927_03935 [Patescibacteria group bacterium]